jgi:hypothetical protein
MNLEKRILRAILNRIKRQKIRSEQRPSASSSWVSLKMMVGSANIRKTKTASLRAL